MYALTQETLQSMEECGSVCYHPLKRLIATTWWRQGTTPIDRKDKRIRTLWNYWSFRQ
jgi:hypothetical protein